MIGRVIRAVFFSSQASATRLSVQYLYGWWHDIRQCDVDISRAEEVGLLKSSRGVAVLRPSCSALHLQPGELLYHHPTVG
jgi:hypothetical protein